MCVGHPEDLAIVIDAVPDPSAGGYPALPLFKRLTVDDARAESALQRMLTAVPCLGSVVIRSHATRASADAAEQTCSHPLAASLVAFRKSQPPCDGVGATRSFRFGTAVNPSASPPDRPQLRARHGVGEQVAGRRTPPRWRATLAEAESPPRQQPEGCLTRTLRRPGPRRYARPTRRVPRGSPPLRCAHCREMPITLAT